MNLVHVQCYSLDPSVFVRRQQVNRQHWLLWPKIKGWRRFQGLYLRLEVMTWKYRRSNLSIDLRKFCFTTIYIITIESEQMDRCVPALVHLLCVCISADSGDSVDSTFSVTTRTLSARMPSTLDGMGTDGGGSKKLKSTKSTKIYEIQFLY